MNVFLLLSILAVSARFTSSLVKRYGGHAKATKTFVDRAEGLVPSEMYKPALDTIQAFILLGIAEWANGDRSRSLVSSLFTGLSNVILIKFHRLTWVLAQQVSYRYCSSRK